MTCPCGCEKKVPFRRRASARVARRVRQTIQELVEFRALLLEAKPEQDVSSIEEFKREGFAYYASIVSSIHRDMPTPQMVPTMTSDWLKRSNKIGYRAKDPKMRVFKHLDSYAKHEKISMDEALEVWSQDPAKDAYTYLKPRPEWQEVVDSLVDVADQAMNSLEEL